MRFARRRRSRCAAGAWALAGAAAIGLAPSGARADLSPIVFHIEAQSTQGSGYFEVTWEQLQPTPPGSNTYDWDLFNEITITDTVTDAPIATLNMAGVFYQFDPSVVVQFAVSAGVADTEFTITSALNSFPTIDPALGRATAGLTVTDVDGDGATLTGLGPGGAAYLSRYNGVVPGGVTFADLLTDPLVAGVGGTAVAAESFPGGGLFDAIGDPVSSMSAGFSFRLTANDTASGTSSFTIIPGPGAMVVLALAVLWPRRRRDTAQGLLSLSS